MAAMGFRAFLVMDNKVARQVMAENGRKWQRIDFRGKMIDNGFSRFLHHGHRGVQEDNGKNGKKGRKW